MFNRFRDSLVYPRRIINYRKDKLIRVLAYVAMFATLATVPILVGVLRFESVPLSEREAFQDNLIDEEIPCVLNNGTLTCDETPIDKIFYENTVPTGLVSLDVTLGVTDEIVPTNDENPAGMTILFGDGTVHFFYAGTQFEMPYSDLPSQFSSLDFKDVNEDPDAFTNQIMDGIGAYLKSIRLLTLSMTFVMGFVMYLLLIMFVVLMNAFVLKMRFKVIPFKETFNMGVYMGTALYILLILNVLFGFGFFVIMLFLIITFRQTNALNSEIMNKMKR